MVPTDFLMSAFKAIVLVLLTLQAYTQTVCTSNLCLNSTSGIYIQMYSPQVLDPSLLIPPYQSMLVDANYSVTFLFNFPSILTQSAIQVWYSITKNHQSMSVYIRQRRPDCTIPLLLNLNLRTIGTSFHHEDFNVPNRICYLALEMKNTTTHYNLTFVIQSSNPIVVGSAVSAANGPLYVFTISNRFGQYVFAPIGPTGFQGGIDLSLLLLYSLVNNGTNATDLLTGLHLVNEVQSGAGTVLFEYALFCMNRRPYFTTDFATCTTPLNSTFVMNLEVLSRILAFNQYVNMSTNCTCTALPDTSLNWKLSVSAYHAKMVMSYGLANTSWRTPIGMYNLPASTNSSMQLLASMAFNMSLDTLNWPVTEAAVCAVLQIRNDYDPSSSSFISASTYPSREIYVCTWSSILQKTTSNAIYINSGVEYLVYDDMSFLNSTVSWPTHFYIAATNSTNTNDLDLYQFVLNTYQSKSLPSEYVVAVDLGVRVHYGSGLWTPLNLSLSAVNLTVPTMPTAIQSYNGIIAKSEQIFRAVASTPNVMLLIKSIKQVLFSLEDYSYYLLVSRPNPNLLSFYQFCWNSTWRRWVPDFLTTNTAHMSIGVNSGVWSEYGKSFPSLSDQSQSIVFSEGTKHYWITYIPLALITAIFLNLLYRLLLRCNFPKLAKLLINFGTSTALMWTLCCQNSQYLSFRCFLNLRAPIARSNLQVFNICSCLVVLFMVVLLSISFPFFLTKLRISYRLFFGHLIPKDFTSQLYVAAWILLRVVHGFAHGYLHQNYCAQLFVIHTSTFLSLLLMLKNHFIFQSKSIYLCIVVRYFGKVLLHTFMLIQAYYVQPSSTVVFQIMAEYEWMAIITIFASTLFEFGCQILGLKKKKQEVAPEPPIVTPKEQTKEKLVIESRRSNIFSQRSSSEPKALEAKESGQECLKPEEAKSRDLRDDKRVSKVPKEQHKTEQQKPTVRFLHEKAAMMKSRVLQLYDTRVQRSEMQDQNDKRKERPQRRQASQK